MPQRIILVGIVSEVSPSELIYALMQERKLGSLPLAKAIGKPQLQSQIYRFSRAQVQKPDYSTAEPLAKFFNLPIEALFDSKVATKIARERNLKVVPLTPKEPPAPSTLKEQLRRIQKVFSELDEPTRVHALTMVLRAIDKAREEAPRVDDPKPLQARQERKRPAASPAEQQRQRARGKSRAARQK